MRKKAAIAALVTLAALGFRLFIALRLPNDEPDDGRVYAQLARNILEHHSYSMETEEPYTPTYIRVPAYPVFLAGVYAVFGPDNNRAVRVVQAVVDTFTCWVVALLAFAWAPAEWDRQKRLRVLLVALALAAACPFPAIYVGTILTETWATLLTTAIALAATLGIKALGRIKSGAWLSAAGLLGGAMTLLRPDGGLFVAGAGLTVTLIGLTRAFVAWRRARAGAGSPLPILARTTLSGLLLSVGFAVGLSPWTIRNVKLFGVFQPVAPANATMPDGFAPLGYVDWLRSWVENGKYIEPLEWNLDRKPIKLDQMPAYAFDSPDERDRVAALLERYNNAPPKSPDTAQAVSPSTGGNDALVDKDKDAGPEEQGDSEGSGDDEEAADGAESDDEPIANVQMTPEIDAGFAEIAHDRISRHPLRYYLVLPAKRAMSLWFDTHSQYYPFQGDLFPLSHLDKDLGQHYWLPLFALLTLIYTTLAIGGAWVLWAGRGSRVWLLLFVAMILPRLAFLGSMENPEPRYVVEFFALAASAGSLALANVSWARLGRLFLERETNKGVPNQQ